MYLTSKTIFAVLLGFLLSFLLFSLSRFNAVEPVPAALQDQL